MISETRLRVRYAETDQMGVVYHSNYLIYFEVGRTDLLRQLGLDYNSMEREDHLRIAVVEVTARYKAPARYDDQLLVRTRIAAVRGSLLRIAYTIHRESDPGSPETLLCEGLTSHVVVSLDMKKSPLPARYAEAFRRAHIPIEPDPEPEL